MSERCRNSATMRCRCAAARHTDNVVVRLGEGGELRLVEHVNLLVDVDGALPDGGKDDTNAASA